jgi:hypothetical protein
LKRRRQRHLRIIVMLTPLNVYVVKHCPNSHSLATH